MSINHKPTKQVPSILLTNDDGPPSTNESPFLHGFVRALKSLWPTTSPLQVRVVIPNSQRSWIGKAYLIKHRIKGSYYYTPLSSGDGTNGQELPSPRAVSGPDEEEWVLLDGTPASCCNIGLFNLYPSQIDLVISGPNFGRNTSSAFSLSSGTLGAALDAALSGVPAVAVSYGVFERPVRKEWVERADRIAVEVVRKLWENGFGGEADLYSVNIPLVPAILDDVEVVITKESTTRYSRLFASTSSLGSSSSAHTDHAVPSAGPGADPASAANGTKPTDPEASDFPPPVTTNEPPPRSPPPSNASQPHPQSTDRPPLDFRFHPDISALVDPRSKAHAPGTDAEALNRGKVTVSPLKACFEGAKGPVELVGAGEKWKL